MGFRLRPRPLGAAVSLVSDVYLFGGVGRAGAMGTISEMGRDGPRKILNAQILARAQISSTRHIS